MKIIFASISKIVTLLRRKFIALVTNLPKQVFSYSKKKHYRTKLEVPVKSDSSRSGLDSALVQKTSNGWRHIAIASQFLNPAEES